MNGDSELGVGSDGCICPFISFVTSIVTNEMVVKSLSIQG